MNILSRVLSGDLYKGHRFPADIITHCVWLYFRFALSYRDVEEMMAEHGGVVTGSSAFPADPNGKLTVPRDAQIYHRVRYPSGNSGKRDMAEAVQQYKEPFLHLSSHFKLKQKQDENNFQTYKDYKR